MLLTGRYEIGDIAVPDRVKLWRGDLLIRGEDDDLEKVEGLRVEHCVGPLDGWTDCLHGLFYPVNPIASFFMTRRMRKIWRIR